MAFESGREHLVETLKNRLPGLFSKDERIIAAYLFGSRADGSAYEGSDLDLGIMLDPESEQAFTLNEELDLEAGVEAALRSDHFDLVVINHVPLPLQFRVISPAKPIYVRDDDKRCETEAHIMVRYYDFEPRLREFNKTYFAALREEYGE